MNMHSLFDMSSWCIVPLLLLLVAALALFWMFDRRLFLTLIRMFGLVLIQLVAVGFYVWLVMTANRWWVYVLWFLLLSFSVGYQASKKARLPWRLSLYVAAAVALSVAVVSGLLLASAPFRLILPVAAVLAAGLYETLGCSLQTYIRSYKNTQAHRYFLLANGASLLESLTPSIRRALRASLVPQFRRLSRPLLVTGTMLFWGLIIGGATADTALFTTLLLYIAVFVATMMAILLTIYFLSNNNY